MKNGIMNVVFLTIFQITNVFETGSDICKKKDITQFGPGLLNTISYITTYLKYITLIMKSKYQYIKI